MSNTKKRWFDVTLPCELAALADKMLKNQFNEDIGTGFIVKVSTPNSLKGRYIITETTSRIVENAYGHAQELEQKNQSIYRFSFSSNQPLSLEIIDPPRSLGRFTKILSEFLGLGFSLSSVSIDVMAWLSEIEKKCAPVEVTHIKYSNINIANKGIASLSVKSSQDIRYEANKLIKNRNHQIDSVKFRNKDLLSITINRSGTVILPIASINEINEIIYEAALRSRIS